MSPRGDIRDLNIWTFAPEDCLPGVHLTDFCNEFSQPLKIQMYKYGLFIVSLVRKATCYRKVGADRKS